MLDNFRLFPHGSFFCQGMKDKLGGNLVLGNCSGDLVGSFFLGIIFYSCFQKSRVLVSAGGGRHRSGEAQWDFVH